MDDLQLRVRHNDTKEKKKGKRSQETKQHKQEGDDNDESEQEAEEGKKQEPETPDETPREFMMRINLYVAVHLSRASGSKRDHYKDGLVFQTRKDLINEFLKATILSNCQNSDCNASVIYACPFTWRFLTVSYTAPPIHFGKKVTQR